MDLASDLDGRWPNHHNGHRESNIELARLLFLVNPGRHVLMAVQGQCIPPQTRAQTWIPARRCWAAP